MDDARQQRGMVIAAQKQIRKTPKGYIVPSQSGQGKYAVIVDGDKATCTCADYELRAEPCKHVYAVRIVIQREFDFANGTVTETVSITKTVKRTYPQNWPAYNAAQTNEGDKFQRLLRDLVAGLPAPAPAPGRGRPRLSLADAVFAATLKVYSTFSARRFMSDLREAHERGYIAKVPHFNSVLNYLDDASVTPILRDLIVQSSLPLKAVELDFAVDSSGFTTSRFESWFDHKYGVTRRQHTWVKAHIMCGVKTNVVTAIEIHERDANDSPILPSLVTATAKHFALAEVSADKAYGSIKNTDTIADLGATPFIAFKSTHTGRGSHRKGAEGSGAWAKAFGYFMYRREEFLAHYHKRSNVETTFSMIKRKFGDSLRSKSDTAMTNEVLAKVLCHNLVVLIHEMYELGIDPVFWAGSTAAQQVPA